MESKLKALKVVELKEILQKANVTIPAKANKPDLIAKIIASPDAIEIFTSNGNPAKSFATPASGASTPIPVAATAAQVATEPPLATPNDDLLAPPEEFDWESSAPKSTHPAKPASHAKSSVTSKPKSTGKPANAKVVTSSDVAIESTPAPPPEAPAEEPQTTEAEDEELARRKARAARFGIPLVATQKPRAAAVRKQRHSAAANGKQPPKATLVDEPEKLKTRAERFGINKPAPESAAVGQKRVADPSEQVDAEEEERRRKRAERFGTVKV